MHESLLAAGRIEHPYIDRNESAIRWIEDRDWWFRSTIDLPGDLDPDERVRLICHGLDTVATLWLDDRNERSAGTPTSTGRTSPTSPARPAESTSC